MNYTEFNNLSPLPIYTVPSGKPIQWDCTKWYAWNEIYPLICKGDMLPFFLHIKGNGFKNAYVYKMCDKRGLNTDLSNFERINPPSGTWLTYLRSHGLTTNGGGLGYFTPQGDSFLSDGFYCIEFLANSDTNRYVSEIFQVRNNMGADTMSVEWYLSDDIVCEGVTVPYGEGWRSKLYLQTTIGMPSYEYEEEGEKRDGIFYPITQLSYKKYRFKFVAPEYMCDSVRLIPLSSGITIKDNEGRILKPSAFDVTFSWLEGGHYAEVDCEFTTDTVVKQIGGNRVVPPNSTFQQQKATQEV